MPELPEVEGVVRDLKPIVEGKTIAQVALSEVVYNSHEAGKQAIVKNSEPYQFEQLLKDMTIQNLQRRSKYIFFHLEKNGEPFVLVNHLGMSGAWFVVQDVTEITEDKFRKHIHAIFTLTTGELLVYSDIRRFGELRFMKEIADHPPLLKMAPEPFDDDACDFFIKQSEKPKFAKKPIKEVIMDGQVISGCGNIYATESLFKTGIYPGRKTNDVSDEEKVGLFHTICDVLQESIDSGGSTISDYRSINGGAGSMQHRLKMYGKKQCLTCGTATESMVIGGRTSVYCPQCQQ
ncbi:DNA-formamidopyrimidine glycosylase [Lysinibacillus sp. 2017]|uniref:bifunctional DNA-formamidopyrimidine glycosylase/DNA-(apurinic or apyrimidinic site) lyase n=1 Tax=unclassified Lysinibacillus TaxID=2636778 RepID=UPI000D52A780|nr:MULTISPECIES: bifunctional DNA-formamidopyrimidine glycosylase/DNA-(apurinic or apyrimidinic site) lyase [unclassified Lysinibacillus]AWE08305.1 DNA-formamidopyrimidine glycosylase [Lysinibacillus sp. 2017]TGN35846.1 bifunctional DNA-formamidopyrimidine glycosylase/DNA-(apurinic or apyrimidinic site) lyase [Lysinibacillus sp. S2017]